MHAIANRIQVALIIFIRVIKGFTLVFICIKFWLFPFSVSISTVSNALHRLPYEHDFSCYCKYHSFPLPQIILMTCLWRYRLMIVICNQITFWAQANLQENYWKSLQFLNEVFWMKQLLNVIAMKFHTKIFFFLGDMDECIRLTNVPKR